MPIFIHFSNIFKLNMGLSENSTPQIHWWIIILVFLDGPFWGIPNAKSGLVGSSSEHQTLSVFAGRLGTGKLQCSNDHPIYHLSISHEFLLDTLSIFIPYFSFVIGSFIIIHWWCWGREIFAEHDHFIVKTVTTGFMTWESFEKKPSINPWIHKMIIGFLLDL